MLRVLILSYSWLSMRNCWVIFCEFRYNLQAILVAKNCLDQGALLHQDVSDAFSLLCYDCPKKLKMSRTTFLSSGIRAAI